MELSASQIRYLVAIYRLCHKGAARSADVAQHLSVTRPSVNRMLTQLAKLGLVHHRRYSFISLTETGLVFAEKYSGYLEMATDFLAQGLDISRGAAEEGALAILSRLETDTLPENGKEPMGLGVYGGG